MWLALALVLCCGVAKSETVAHRRAQLVAHPQLLARAIGQLGDRTFLVDIADGPLKSVSRKKLLNRTLDIRCMKGCSGKVAYHEDFVQPPLGVFRLSDLASQFVILSVGGSAYFVRVYDVGGPGIKKIFDEGTKAPPQFTYGADGALTILTTDGNNVTHRWKWNGTEYQGEDGAGVKYPSDPEKK